MQKKPLILHAVSRMAVGGVQNCVLQALRRGNRRRFDFGVICTKKAGNWAHRVMELGVPVFVQKTLPPWDPYQIWRLSRYIAAVKPDLVHVHMSQMVIPAVAAARRAGVRRVIVQHHNLYDQYWAEQGRILRAWERRLTLGADAIVAVSRAVADCTSECLGILKEKIEVVPNGLDLEEFRSAPRKDPRPEWGLAPGTPLVVQVTRLSPYKRVEDFIDAAAICLSRWKSPGPPPAFVVVGGGSPPEERQYAEQIKRKGLEGRVILAGTRMDVPSILPAADAAALSSEREGFGLVLLEYLAAGLPIAATAIPTTLELLKDGEDGLLSPPRDPEALAQNIERLLEGRELARGLAERGQRKLANYSWDATARGYEEIYTRLLTAADD